MKRIAIALLVLLFSLPMALNAALSAPACTPVSTTAAADHAGGHGPCCAIAALTAACAFACQPTVLQTAASLVPALAVTSASFGNADTRVSGLDLQPPAPPPRQQVST